MSIGLAFCPPFPHPPFRYVAAVSKQDLSLSLVAHRADYRSPWTPSAGMNHCYIYMVTQYSNTEKGNIPKVYTFICGLLSCLPIPFHSIIYIEMEIKSKKKKSIHHRKKKNERRTKDLEERRRRRRKKKKEKKRKEKKRRRRRRRREQQTTTTTNNEKREERRRREMTWTILNR